MRDFTLTIYKQLLLKLKESNFRFITYYDYISIEKSEKNYKKIENEKILILRHDVDRLPANALTTAQIEKELNIKGTYYFRVMPKSYDTKIIQRISELGHEVGYHYEDVDLVWRNRKSIIGSRQSANLNNESLIDVAFESFCKNLDKLRQIADIKTICMHGSPLSKYDNKLLWTKYDYRELGIIGEPYLDIDWNEFGYLTDTGRRWDGVAVRDKVKSKNEKLKFKFRKTLDIIHNIDTLQDKLMITVHPERWTDDWFLWSKQLIWQNIKNLLKIAYNSKN